MINARAETVATKPAFRNAFHRRRCLIPADGFYEWKKTGRIRQPYFIRLKDGLPLAFAGLWEEWRSPDGQAIGSCAIIVTRANALVQPIHDRMPVILEPQRVRAVAQHGHHRRRGLDSTPRALPARGHGSIPGR